MTLLCGAFRALRALVLPAIVACLGALAPMQAAEAAKLGEGCSLFYPCDAGLSCHPFVQKCFNVPRRESQPCMAGHGCADGLVCEAGSQVCRALGKSGEACHLTRPCAPGLSCQPGVHRCYSEPRAENEPCSAGFGCGPGLTCEAGAQVCRASGKVGDACHLTRPCGAGLSCQPGVQRCYHSPRLENEPCVAGFGCAAGLSCAAGKQVCEVLAAKQCVMNMAGYSAKVEWWKPSDLTYEEANGVFTMKPVQDRLSANSVKDRVAAQVDKAVTLGFSSCNNSKEQRTAVVRIEGGKYVNGAIATSVGIVISAATAAGAAVVCIGTAGAGCAPAVVGGVAAAAAGISAATGFISTFMPDAQEIAFVGTPATTQEVKMTGTVWAPTWEYGTLRGGLAAHAGGANTPAGGGGSSPVQACRDAVQDKVAWSRGGSKRWMDQNLNALCDGARTPSAIVACVNEGITAHNDWQRAIRECKGR